jgi:Holliday junction resolvasome RuvABC ATP-dependent DNA helicase subunit
LAQQLVPIINRSNARQIHIQSRLQYYNTELLTTIVQRSASILRVPITIMEAAVEQQEEVAERQE